MYMYLHKMKQEVNRVFPVEASYKEIRDWLLYKAESKIDFWKHDLVRLRQ